MSPSHVNSSKWAPALGRTGVGDHHQPLYQNRQNPYSWKAIWGIKESWSFFKKNNVGNAWQLWMSIEDSRFSSPVQTWQLRKPRLSNNSSGKVGLQAYRMLLGDHSGHHHHHSISYVWKVSRSNILLVERLRSNIMWLEILHITYTCREMLGNAFGLFPSTVLSFDAGWWTNLKN